LNFVVQTPLDCSTEIQYNRLEPSSSSEPLKFNTNNKKKMKIFIVLPSLAVIALVLCVQTTQAKFSEISRVEDMQTAASGVGGKGGAAVVGFKAGKVQLKSPFLNHR
jgi:hypothetical protein